MVEGKRSEAILKNLARELLTAEESNQFKQALHHFRVSKSVPSLVQALKPIINNTAKLVLLVELSTRMPPSLQEDFHTLCSLQFPNYETYLKFYQKGNTSNSMPKIIAQDAAGRLKIINGGPSERKMMMKYNNQKQAYEIRSLPGTSVTSGVYSNGSNTDDDSVFDDDHKMTNGRATPVHLQGKKNVHKVDLHLFK